MKTKQFQIIAKQLIPLLPGKFVLSKKFILKDPVRHIMQGFTFTASAFSKESFYFYVFSQPLYVPRKHLVLSIGERLAPCSYPHSWSFQADLTPTIVKDMLESIRLRGLIFLSKTDEPGKIATLSRRPEYDNLNIAETEAYSLVMCNDFSSAIIVLDRICDKGRSGGRPLFDWEIDAVSRCNLIRESLGRNPADALAILKQWERETALHLGILPFAEEFSEEQK